MLRITADEQNDGVVTLRLEGVIRAQWVPEIEVTCRRAANKASGVQLDLAQVRFVDEVGVEALKRLVATGVTIGGCTDFVRELLHAEDVR